VFAPGGSAAGQVNDPISVAVDQSTGMVYVSDANNARIDEFKRNGTFVRAFGYGVVDGANELEICTTSCVKGGLSEAPDAIDPDGLVVNSATHDVYVSEPLQNRVAEFTENGAFVTAFGKGVDKKGHPGNVCSAAFIKEGDECGKGIPTTEPGGFGDEGETPPGLPLALDASGDIWVGEIDRLEKFNASGEFLQELALPGGGRLGALGLDTLGNFFILDSAEEALQKLDAKGARLFTLDGPPGHPRALTLGGAEGLFAGDEGPPYHLIEFNAASGEEEEVFGAGNVIGNPNHENGTLQEAGNALAFDNTTGTVYAASCEPVPPSGADLSAVTALAVPAPGPLQRRLKAEEVRGTHAELTDLLNAEGAETEYRFEYVDDATFTADKGHEFEHATSLPPQKLPASFADTAISAEIKGLKSETTYHFRVTAHNARGNLQTAEEAHEQEVLTTEPPVEIDASYVTAVTTDSATLNALMNPEGAASSFHFEYLPASAYQANLDAGRAPFTGALMSPVPDGSLGAGETAVIVTQTVSGLAAGTTYEFRVVGTNVGGSGASAAKVFNTRPTGEATLPDGREWELVSPLEKHGGLFEGINDTGIVQASQAGGGITYLATRPTEESPQGYLLKEQVLSQRTARGWVSRDLSLPHETAPGVSLGAGEEYRFFSEDLSAGIAQPFGVFDPTVSEEATEESPLLRGTGPGEGYLPLVIGCPPPGQECSPAVESHADVPAGTRFGIDVVSHEPCTGRSLICGVQYVGASSDGRHVILSSPVVGLTARPGDHGGLYEWSEGHLTLISVLPNNLPAEYKSFEDVPKLGRFATGPSATTAGAITADGTRVDWTFKGHLYQRDLGTGESAIPKTIKIDEPGTGAGSQPKETQPEFQGASADGRVVFFTDQQKLLKEASPAERAPDLYRCAIAEGASKCALSDLAPGADIVGASLGISSDGAYMYFVADGALAAGAEGGTCAPTGEFTPNAECPLYEWHEGTIKLVARLSGEDAPDWRVESSRQTSRLSPNGQWLEFMSQRSLTGYENADAHSGEPDEEVFLYNAGVGSLDCASCNPSGQRPTGARYGTKHSQNGSEESLSGGNRIWLSTTWIAANVPGWTSYLTGDAQHQPRYLSDSGRLFFDSSDNLATTDANSAEDVYEFEPAGVGGCATTTASFVSANGGCVNLVSSGTSPIESAFLDASESGNDVFFLSAAQLAGGDKDDAIDVYDAHVCQPSDPCVAAPRAAVEQCSGEGCQPQAAAPPGPTIGSQLASGLGNLAPLPAAQHKPTPKRKATPAQRLRRALKACRRKHSRRARRQCEAQARRAYRAAVKHAKHARSIP